MTDLAITLLPRRSALVAGHDNTLDVLVRVAAPERPAGASARKRAELNLAIVLDRSGSMSGAPLEEAKRTARFIVDHLEATDRCALVVYDHTAETLVPAIPPTEKGRFYDAIGGIRSRGNTDLHAGWLAGADALARYVTETSVSRVLLLSDGNANAGVSDVAELANRAGRLAATGVTTSTFGLGHHFNEGLMSEMAVAGHGRAYYGETADDLLSPFREEFDLLNALAARKLALKLKPTPGISVEVLNDYPRNADGDVHLPDVAWNTEAWALLRLTVPAHMLVLANMVELLSVAVRYTDLDGRTHGIGSSQLVLPVMDPTAYGAVAEAELVVRRAAEAVAARLQRRASEAAVNGDWAAVDRLIAEMHALAERNPWIKELIDVSLELARARDQRRFSKESTYTASRLSSKLAAREEGIDLASDAAMPSYLERKLRQGKKRGDSA